MAIKLKDVASAAEDLFYQDYAPRDKFFDTSDFALHFAVIYADMLNEEFQDIRKRNKAEEGFANIEIPASWMITERLTLSLDAENNRHTAETAYPIFTFRWDSSQYALQGIHSIGSHHCVYRKISLNERRFRQVLPEISKVLFFVNSEKQIVFWGGKDGAVVETQYIPEVDLDDDDCLIANGLASKVIDKTLQRMFGAKNGNVIDENNDSNKNAVLPQQINPTTTTKM